MWKTRLRCALNKSTDFQEVPERNQLDITEPYKVYLILNNSAPARSTGKLFSYLVVFEVLSEESLLICKAKYENKL